MKQEEFSSVLISYKRAQSARESDVPCVFSGAASCTFQGLKVNHSFTKVSEQAHMLEREVRNYACTYGQTISSEKPH